MEDSEIFVSIICYTYNQEKYVANALDSFVSQKTKFSFEILVHDDASSDNTASIIRKYEEKYPNLIKPMYRKENRYSKGLSFGQIERARGKYIAFCEGDDYWIDSFKLQKQVDALELHPECDICAHAAKKIDAVTNKEIGIIAHGKLDTIFEAEVVITGGGIFVATNSLMLRRQIFENEPPFRKILNLDYTMQINGSLRGGMLYLAEYMSVYRVNVRESWSARMAQDKEAWCNHIDKMIVMLKQLDIDTNGKYKKCIEKLIDCHQINKLNRMGLYKEIVRNYKKEMKSLPLKEQLKMYIKAWIPVLVKWRHANCNIQKKY